MAVALGAFDPKMDPQEAYRRLCLCFPDLPERVERAKREYCQNSIFQHYINREYDGSIVP